MNYEQCDLSVGALVSRRQFLAILIQLLAVAGMPGCRKSVPVLDGSSSIKPYVAEDHSQFLSRWAEQGVRDAVLINIDTHNDIVRIPDEKLTELRTIYQSRDWSRFKDEDEHLSAHQRLYGIATWIYAGGMLGMFKEVYWVIPYNYLDHNDSGVALHRLLADLKFREEDRATFALQGDKFKGSVNGIPFTLCGLTSLPTIKSSVLLSVDIDFFPTYSTVYQASFLNVLHRVFTALYAKKYKILDAGICYSVNGEYLLPHLRWIGEAVQKIFADPGMIINNSPTELLNLQQHLENSFRSGEPDEILTRSEHYLNQHPEPSLHLYRAYALLLKGDDNGAYREAMESCRLDNLYCSGVQYMGTMYSLRKQYQTAEKFYRGGFSANPKMVVGLFQYGNCLQKNGKLSEALHAYERCVSTNGSFPCHFMMAGVYIKLGDRNSVERTLREAVHELDKYLAPRIQNQPAADAMYEILYYCDKEGLSDLSDALRSRTMTKTMFNDFPRAASSL